MRLRPRLKADASKFTRRRRTNSVRRVLSSASLMMASAFLSNSKLGYLVRSSLPRKKVVLGWDYGSAAASLKSMGVAFSCMEVTARAVREQQLGYFSPCGLFLLKK